MGRAGAQGGLRLAPQPALQAQDAVEAGVAERGEHGGERDVARARLMAVGVAHVDLAEPRHRLAQRRAGIVLLDVHVVRVGQQPDRRAAHGRAQRGALGERVDHVVLVAVERLEQHADAARLGPRGQPGERARAAPPGPPPRSAAA